jgi:hypothetical protein
VTRRSAAGIVVIPGGCRGLPRRFGCEGATCHRAIGVVNGSFAAQPPDSRPAAGIVVIPGGCHGLPRQGSEGNGANMPSVRLRDG